MLPRKLEVAREHTCDVSAGPRQTPQKSAADRIGVRGNDDRYRDCGMRGSDERILLVGHNDLDRQGGQFGGECW